jgi:HEAT repeat protein
MILPFPVACRAQLTRRDVQQFYSSRASDAEPKRYVDGDPVQYAQKLELLPDSEVLQLIPTLLKLLRVNDHQVRSDGLLAFFSIGQRTDGADILRPYLGEIGELLKLNDPTLPRATATFMSSIHPSPPKEVIGPLLEFLARTDASPEAQAAAIFTLVRLAPQDPYVIADVKAFAVRTFSSSEREAMLNALGSPEVKDVSLREVAYAALTDKDPGVRLTAVQSISRMGGDAVAQVKTRLTEMANSPTEPENVRTAARDALARASR